MARASIEYRFTDGAVVIVSVETSNDYPDAQSDCVSRAMELYRQVVPTDEAE